MTTIISFNINGVRARPHQLEAIRDQLNPDVLGLQETKVQDAEFPLADIQALGFHVEFFGQKGHYGVALLSKTAPVFVQKGWPWDDAEAQKRIIHARYEIDGKIWNVLNGYFPQGESRDHETKFPAKEKFYADLQRYLDENFTPADRVIVMGDMNISPEDTDIGIGEPNRKRWLKTGKCSFLPEEREWYQRLLGWGLQDTYRKHYPASNDTFSWFDYRSKGFDDEPKRGLRIDHILATPAVYEECTAAGVSYDIRALEKPSDHAPIWATFS
ncbi:exodeoxyribonuclease III [Thalassolituus hydrocarboniclasticus]|uniref:Exodeoxyribonuclease III n=1 Tax=Thalassolituus hydrocarboniclasticus TaxID=2742796 RepID=A0ABY6A9Y0_9GAMM|nr:exodeoxyribonuclease III [Thalassolituus hydrocarboniclasticus]UXD87492.1 exodeoxyribonuclease III [Thalassolituus hydrocarboniclasticus]